MERARDQITPLAFVSASVAIMALGWVTPRYGIQLQSRMWKIWMFVLYLGAVIISGIYSTYIYLKTHYESELSDKWMLVLSIGTGALLMVASPVIRGVLKTQLLFTVIFTLTLMADESWTYWASVGGAVVLYLLSMMLKRSMLVTFIAFSAVTSYWVLMGSLWLGHHESLVDLYPTESSEWALIGVLTLARMIYVGYMETRYWKSPPPWSSAHSQDDDGPAYEMVQLIIE